MVDVLSWVFLPGIGLFLGLSICTFVALRGESRHAAGAMELEMGEISAGAETRKRFFVLLLIAASARLVSLSVDLVALSLSPGDSDLAFLPRKNTTNASIAWVSSIFSLLPCLFFVSTYSLLILFYAQLCTACYGLSFPLHKAAYFACNLLLYVGFVVLMFATHSTGSFWKWTQGGLGCFYICGFLAILYYSGRLVVFFRSTHVEDDFFFDMDVSMHASFRGLTPRQIVVRRIMLICAMCCALFLGLGVYLLCMATAAIPSWHDQYRTPAGLDPYIFELGVYILTEFLPCALLLYFTHRTASATSTTARSGKDAMLDETHTLLRADDAPYHYQTTPMTATNPAAAGVPPRPYLPRNNSSGTFERSPMGSSSSFA
ncbi:hypothetical protein SDRG_03058 [Saprolegnia diclina VS20]|uniref:THH1/TOM1/TOM3 domain-containing protein n=1 Tax=Saprolegnia diclina (strain VS20) TaxID=1156394 RepID=T0SA13_SAPDV|nr:hypothetical protein SDRG_03058 [Saprolegnia diclina VS20]EQC39627.1 hypothetical protein SDRG_03058 [Saprolegnia diclina VS20]|eukprot:XP_008606899.1 hypothetical protein SDRG_03058 [Saprolegnia diclina VS20]